MALRILGSAKTSRIPGLLLTAACLAAMCVPFPALAADGQAVPVSLGHSVLPLDGPWRFHTGDDPRWVDPGFDDSSWETLDLTPPPGAHDDDVGLTGFVPGWGAHGHTGYT